MRWNCPHCEELVTAGIDFANTQKAYVRCKKCNGMAIIHRSAALANYLNSEIKMNEAKVEFEREIEKLKTNSKLEIAAAAAVAAATSAPSPSPANSMGMEMISTESPRTPTPPPFRGTQTDVAAAAPRFSYPKPPAFLLKNSEPNQKTQTKNVPNSKLAQLAVWIAATLAIASGTYLFIQGRKALSNSETTAKNSTADHILSNSSSTIRNIGIIRVPRAIYRSSPSISGTALGTLEQSQTLSIFEDKDGWTRVESPKVKTNTNSAWVRTDLISRVPN